MPLPARVAETAAKGAELAGEFGGIRKDFGTLGEHLKNASNRYADIDRAFDRFGDRLALSLQEPAQPSLPEPVNGSDEPPG